MNLTKEDNPPIWSTFCRALGAEHRDAREVIGASGLVHPVEAIGVDEAEKRLILVSSETNPRVAALLRGDVQATIPDFRVLVARPLAVDLAHVIRSAFFTESGGIDIEKILKIAALLQGGGDSKDEISDLIQPPMINFLSDLDKSRLPVKNHVFNVVEQLHSFDWSAIGPISSSNIMQPIVNALTGFSRIDSLADDREQGICPIPTYELTEADWDMFSTIRNIEDIQERLKELNIYQYFYPPSDSLALGLIDRGITSSSVLENGFYISSAQGHEISPNSFLAETEDLSDLIEELKSKGYVVDGEFSMELSDKGKSFRRTVNIRPSEGLISKISKLASLKVDLNLRDIFGSR